MVGWETKRAVRLTRMAGIVRRADRRRKPLSARPCRASAGAVQQLPVERHDLVDPARRRRSGPLPRGASVGHGAAPLRVAGQRHDAVPRRVARVDSVPPATTTPSTPSRTDRPRPDPSIATAGRPTASASARTSPWVSVRDAKAKRSAPASRANASSRGSAPVQRDAAARSGAAARAAVASAAGPPPTSTSRSRGSLPTATAKASSSTPTLFSGASRPSVADDHARRPAIRRRAEIERRAAPGCARRRSPVGMTCTAAGAAPPQPLSGSRRPGRVAGATMAAQPAQKSPQVRIQVPLGHGPPAGRGSGRSRRSGCGG